MKVGITTFHRARNYGAVLQTYALQKALENLNIESDVIDYRENAIDLNYKLLSKKSAKKFIRDIAYFPILNKKYKKIENFVNNNIKLSEKKPTNLEELKKLENDYDTFITGSDQVWNYRLTKWDEGYFLNFVSNNKKKNSYAASFGLNEIPEKEKEKYKMMLKDYNYISVREEQGTKIVKNLINNEVTQDVDPTLLIRKNEWESIAKLPKEKDYILIFVMQKNKSIFEFAEKLAQKTNCEIIYIADSLKKRIKGKYKYTVSPEEWLGYFINAKYVITNSFHGLAFSINLNKEFFLEMQVPPATGNSRLETLLDRFNLRDREIINCENNHIDEKIILTS